jgi:hypothetical protein
MEKLKKEEITGLLPVRQGRTTKLRAMLLQLEVGEGLFMPKEEWKRKNTPFYIIARLKKTSGLRFEYGLKTDGSGWLFRRVA